jgi:CRP-like cAMP-binding protein
LPERGIVLGPGEIIGEIGIFSPFQARTTSAICETAVTALVLSHHKVLELYYQNPAFGLYLGRMIIRRLLTDVEHEKARLTAPAPHAPLGGPTPHA